VFAPGEIAPLRHLYVVSRGLILYGGRVVSRGMTWGDDVILSDQQYFLPHHARAMTYVDANAISREALANVVRAFPASAKVLRRATILLARRRPMIAEAKRMLRDREPAEGEYRALRRSSLLRHGKRDFIDRIHEANDLTVTKEQHKCAEMAHELGEFSSGMAGSVPRMSRTKTAELRLNNDGSHVGEEALSWIKDLTRIVNGMRQDQGAVVDQVKALAQAVSVLQATVQRQSRIAPKLAAPPPQAESTPRKPPPPASWKLTGFGRSFSSRRRSSNNAVLPEP
jgi:L-fucose mutarotase/ribose pyranase (RbsD/FucU family)